MNDGSKNGTEKWQLLLANNFTLQLRSIAKCQSIYYCTREHQLAHWKSYKKFCALLSEDPRAKVKEFGTVLDTESEVLDLKITKTKKSLGIVLQMDEQEKVVFINDIVNSDISILKAGDQILRINNKKINSVQGITQIVSQADIGNDIEFKIKRPKKEVNWQICKLKTQS